MTQERRLLAFAVTLLVCLSLGSYGQAAAGDDDDEGASGPRRLKKCGEITEPGSYVLVKNLFVPSPKSCIKISARYVTLDLGGFAIIGVGDRVPGFRAITCSSSATP